MIGEGGFAEADPARVFVKGFAAAEQANMNVIQMRILKVPKLDVAEAGQREGVLCRICSGFGTGMDRGRGLGVHRGVRIGCGGQASGA